MKLGIIGVGAVGSATAMAAAPQAVMLVATDPPEPLVDVARQLAGHDRVMGTSTYLDSLRFRLHVGERLGVGPGTGSYNPRFGTTVSLPSIVGRHGVIEVLEPAMSDEEKQGLERSAARLSETVRQYIGAWGRS
jgi:malate/lactate dehydrogenase